MNLLRRLLGLSHRGPRVLTMQPTDQTVSYNEGGPSTLDVTFFGTGSLTDRCWTRPHRVGYWTRVRGLLWIVHLDVALGSMLGAAIGLAIGLALG